MHAGEDVAKRNRVCLLGLGANGLHKVARLDHVRAALAWLALGLYIRGKNIFYFLKFFCGKAVVSFFLLQDFGVKNSQNAVNIHQSPTVYGQYYMTYFTCIINVYFLYIRHKYCICVKCIEYVHA